MSTDEELIEQARTAERMGHVNDLDKWRLRRAEQREQMVQKKLPIDAITLVRKITFNAQGDAEYTIDPEVAAVLNEWWHNNHNLAMRDIVYPDLAWAMDQREDQMRRDLREQDEKLKQTVENLRLEIAELRGELRALLAERSKIWRPGDAAA